MSAFALALLLAGPPAAAAPAAGAAVSPVSIPAGVVDAAGAVALVPGARLPPAPLTRAPPAGAPRLARFHARAADERVMRGGPPPHVEGVLVVDGGGVGFEHAPGKVTVHRFGVDGRARAAPVVLAAEADAVWVTLDRGHVALRRARDQRRVDLYRLEGGPPLATLEAPIDLAVVGGRLFWTRPSGRGVALSVLDLASARTLWERELLPPEGPPGEPIP